MPTTLTPMNASVVKGLAALERLLDSTDERVTLKAAELLLRWHPDMQKRKPGATEAEVDAPPEAAPTPVPVAPPAPQPASTAKKKVLLASFLPPPPPPRSTGPLPMSLQDAARTLKSFLRAPNSTADPPRAGEAPCKPGALAGNSDSA